VLSLLTPQNALMINTIMNKFGLNKIYNMMGMKDLLANLVVVVLDFFARNLSGVFSLL